MSAQGELTQDKLKKHCNFTKAQLIFALYCFLRVLRQPEPGEYNVLGYRLKSKLIVLIW